MQTIWNFPFALSGSIEIQLPEGARIIHVGMRGESPCLWAMVNTKVPMKLRRFRVFGTGHPIPELSHDQFIGTVFQGCFVWHIFEVSA